MTPAPSPGPCARCGDPEEDHVDESNLLGVVLVGRCDECDCPRFLPAYVPPAPSGEVGKRAEVAE